MRETLQVKQIQFCVYVFFVIMFVFNQAQFHEPGVKRCLPTSMN